MNLTFHNISITKLWFGLAKLILRLISISYFPSPTHRVHLGQHLALSLMIPIINSTSNENDQQDKRSYREEADIVGEKGGYIEGANSKGMGKCADNKQEKGDPFIVEQMIHGVGKCCKEEDAHDGKEVRLVLVEYDCGGGQEYLSNEFHDDEVGFGIKWFFEVLPIFLQVVLFKQVVNVV